MKRDGITELFDYTGWAWERFERIIDGLPEGAYADPVAGSGWPSIAACMTHFVAAYDGWINHEFGGLNLGEMSYPATYPEPVTSWADMKTYYQRCRDSFRRALALPDDQFYAKKTYDIQEQPGDPPEELSPADILANLVIHERGHHGDLSTLFHTLGVRSFLVDFRYFTTRRADFVMDE
jgi:uncharacterized damage-inducible protein DinB